MNTPLNLPTRQQLEEIDALLKRMLALPPLAADAGNTEILPPRVVEYSPPPAMVPPTIRDTTPPAAAPGVDPVIQSWRVSWPTAASPAAPAPQPVPMPANSLTSWGQPVAPPTVQLQPVPIPIPPAVPPQTLVPPPGQPLSYGNFFPLPADARKVTAETATDEPLSPFFLPLTVLNVAFDLITYLFGPLGRWMRYDGRRLLGWMGILMILGASAWAIGEWRGIEWPKPPIEKVRSHLPEWLK